MYKCRVEKRIRHHATNPSDYTSLRYELDVEIAPERGHVLKDGKWYSGPITNVIWSIHDGCFHCRVKDELPFIQDNEDYSHDWLVETYQQEGWLPFIGRVVRTD
ncbi:hypothetical protein [Kaarinaea lacus]